ASYAAGRYRQLKENSDALPYWQYRHSHLASTPRQQHLAWDGMVLAHDDPFWTTHYPPNGWGCGCYVIGVTRGRLERMGRTGPDRAPAIRTREVLVGKNGPHPRLVSVPEGIDPGWAYAPGQSVVRTYLDKLAVQQPGVAAAQYREAMGLERLVAERTRAWHGWLDGDRRSLDHWFVLGMVESGVQRALGDHGRILETAALTTTRSDILHGGRKTKRARGTALSEADLRRLPEIVERPKAVLLDTGKRHDALIYVFDSEDGGGRLGKAVFRPNWRGKRGITNGYRSGGYVDRGNLRERRYVVLSGSLEGEE
ncbi:MAG: hypothetical protein F4244_11915, partial [Gammaproteobacteria bacterium]|nr:hypothetical protein [Gammaproteobacteria bacterium]